jgi:aspartate/methionine/tyrosine aminotransferase
MQGMPFLKSKNPVFQSLGTTIFETMSRLAVETGSVNLGQGFPEGLEPRALLERLAQAATSGLHQYPSMMGIPSLRQAIARHENRFWGIDLDPMRSVMVTSGGTEALAASLLALIEPGDEVIVLEPCYDSYIPIIQLAQGIVRTIRLSPPGWVLPREELDAAFSEKTKLIVLNTPTNPIGKVFTQDDLTFLSELILRYDCYAVCDEVYEHLVYDGSIHRPLMTLPGMSERCVKIGSAGKIFSLTGWKVGWITAAPELLSVLAKAHQFLTFTTPPELQEAVAWGLDECEDVYVELPQILAKRRDKLANGLTKAGFTVLPTYGSYFLTAQYTALTDLRDDEAFCRQLVDEAGVAAIPLSAFYRDGFPTGCIRFCFAKTDVVLDEAILRLKQWSIRR